jgi:hypothetical protein
MNRISIRIIIVHAFVGWILCAATMGIGTVITTVDNALYIHAILAPVFFFAVSLNYFRKYRSISPVKTAVAFVAFVIFMDFFVVALVIKRNLDIFSSILETWIPFFLIFVSTYATGRIVNYKRI